jgi:hypothetical protein
MEPSMPKKNEGVRELLGITFFSVDEVARKTGNGRQSVLQAIDDGKLLARKVGGVWLVHPIWCEAWQTTPTEGPRTADNDDDDLRIAIARIKQNRVKERRATRAARRAAEEET